MNSKFERSVISALCVGLIFCFLAVATPAQDNPNLPAQITQGVPSQPCPQPCAQIYPQPCPASAPCPAQPYPQTYPQTYPQIYTQPYPQVYSQPYPQAYAQPYPQTYPQVYAQPYPQVYAQPYPQSYPQVYAQPYPQSYPQVYAQPYPQSYPQVYAQPYPQSYPQVYAQPYPQSYPQVYWQPYPQPCPYLYSQPYPPYYSQACPSPCSGDNGDKVKDAQEGSADAAEVFRDIAVVRDKIPPDVLANAVAIGVFKGVFNAAFIGGYRQGDGAITIRTPNGWSAPVYYKMKGGSFGLQFGAESTDYVLVFMSQEAIHDLADGEFDLSHDANLVAGPVFGKKVSIGHRDFPKPKTVFVYARSRGLFAGVLIDGAKLYARNSVNRALYGKNARELLSNPQQTLALYATSLPPGVSDLPQTVAANVPNPQPVCVAIAQPPPMPTVAPIPYAPPVPAPVVQVFDEGKDDMLELEDQSAPRWVNSCCRVRKLKN